MSFNVPETESTPLIHYIAQPPTLVIEGESYPENVAEFYAPVLSWIDHHVTDDSALLLRLKLFYLNTGSTKALIDILRTLERKHQAGADIEIEWLYLRDLELMRQAGEELLGGSTIPYRIQAIDAF